MFAIPDILLFAANSSISGKNFFLLFLLVSLNFPLTLTGDKRVQGRVFDMPVVHSCVYDARGSSCARLVFLKIKTLSVSHRIDRRSSPFLVETTMQLHNTQICACWPMNAPKLIALPHAHTVNRAYTPSALTGTYHSVVTISMWVHN